MIQAAIMGIHILITLQHPLAVCPLHLPLRPGWFSSQPFSAILLLLVYLLPSCAARARARVREGERERPFSPTGLSLPISAPSCVYTPVRSFVFAYRPLVPRLFLSPVALAVLHRLLSHPPLSPLPLVFLAPEAMHLRRTLTSPLRLLHEVRSVLLVEESRPLLFSAPLACLLASSLLAVCFFFFSFFLTPSLSLSLFSRLPLFSRGLVFTAVPPGINQARREATALASGHRRRISISCVEKLIGWPRKRAYLFPRIGGGSFRFVLGIAESLSSPLFPVLSFTSPDGWGGGAHGERRL